MTIRIVNDMLAILEYCIVSFSQNGLEYVMTYHDDPQLMYSGIAFSFATRIGLYMYIWF